MSIREALEEIRAEGIAVSTSIEDRIAYCKDYNPLHLPKLLNREFSALPDAVVFPKSTEEVSTVLKIANTYGIPVYVFGGGSGVIDAATPYDGGLVLSTLSIDHIEVDEENMVVRAGAGVVGGRLEKILNHRALHSATPPRAFTAPPLVDGSLQQQAVSSQRATATSRTFLSPLLPCFQMVKLLLRGQLQEERGQI